MADRAALARLARWCRRFSPTVGIEVTAGEAAARGLRSVYNVVLPTHPDRDAVTKWLVGRGFTGDESGSTLRRSTRA